MSNFKFFRLFANDFSANSMTRVDHQSSSVRPHAIEQTRSFREIFFEILKQKIYPARNRCGSVRLRKRAYHRTVYFGHVTWSLVRHSVKAFLPVPSKSPTGIRMKSWSWNSFIEIRKMTPTQIFWKKWKFYEVLNTKTSSDLLACFTRTRKWISSQNLLNVER